MLENGVSLVHTLISLNEFFSLVSVLYVYMFRFEYSARKVDANFQRTVIVCI